MKVLVLDDSRAMRTILKKILEALGATVQEAKSGQEGLEMLRADFLPDIVLVDWNMPGMSGLDVVRAIRTNPAYDRLLIMMVTAETERSQMGKALAEGANEYVMKPFTKEVIQEKLKILGV